MQSLIAFARAFAGSWPGFPLSLSFSLSLSQSSEILAYHAIPLL